MSQPTQADVPELKRLRAEARAKLDEVYRGRAHHSLPAADKQDAEDQLNRIGGYDYWLRQLEN